MVVVSVWILFKRGGEGHWWFLGMPFSLVLESGHLGDV